MPMHEDAELAFRAGRLAAIEATRLAIAKADDDLTGLIFDLVRRLNEQHSAEAVVVLAAELACHHAAALTAYAMERGTPVEQLVDGLALANVTHYDPKHWERRNEE